MQTQVRARSPSSSSLCCEEAFQWLHLGSGTCGKDGIRVHRNILVLIVLKSDHNCRKTSTNSSSGSEKVMGLCTLGFWDTQPPPSQVGIAVLEARKLNFQFTGGNWAFWGWEAQLSLHMLDLLVWRLRSPRTPHRRRKMSHQEMSWMFRSPELILSAQLSCWGMPGIKQGWGWGWNPHCCGWPSKQWSKDTEPRRERQCWKHGTWNASDFEVIAAEE